MTAETLPGRWVARSRTSDDVRLRLLCFPHVGAGATAFRAWIPHLPPGVELCAVRLPGRENRLAEPLLDSPDALFPLLDPALETLLDLPFAVIGHCSGSVLAYEYVRRLQRAGGPPPRHIVLSSAPGAAVRQINDPLHLLPRDELIARVSEFGGMPEAVSSDADLMTMFERILRADYRVIELLTYSTGAPLDVPITVLGGRRDEFVTVCEMAAWSEATSKEFTLHLLDAGHYVLYKAAATIGRLVREISEAGNDEH
ncbi:thioesterase II family protein [Micromonospora marina]|uniref:Medium-chain acyl-[acyl-carrier-protein] hydrolase n=1 Tax=Micromonospora marina TaxID=307120 RepID=A0A1C5AIK8_9ACTN|nr:MULTISPECIES: alpha/beta fold hydrolase [Micromonospora]SCF45033.1 medium-chain acyl-[acyl-carrier-protein] hydrolase [Micromonospora marina]